ncbi:hypothetical protein N836_00180 [Leptolyngbya sp. Heron Island J]|uniref:hypothetical protein n=1 Tax=Leptolyngbya sp. Heron Island J TaxID=1385935 RepID=UPI0003B9CBEC|nr:hypothetical protein [Leptolyngbya sp. Heron Island J]ESA37131.1 hypothetical protein N836_00180 [Leptolyngbya sp. Heron Island J]
MNDDQNPQKPFDPNVLVFKQHRKASEVLNQHYGEDPAVIAAQYFTTANDRTYLRGLMYRQADRLYWEGRSQGDIQSKPDIFLARESWIAGLKESSLGQALQARLDSEGIIIRPFEEGRRLYKQLSNEEFYKQAIQFVYCMATVTTEYLQQLDYEKWFEDHSKTHPEIYKRQQKQGYLQCDIYQGNPRCDLPPNYLAALQAEQQLQALLAER